MVRDGDKYGDDANWSSQFELHTDKTQEELDITFAWRKSIQIYDVPT